MLEDTKTTIDLGCRMINEKLEALGIAQRVGYRLVLGGWQFLYDGDPEEWPVMSAADIQSAMLGFVAGLDAQLTLISKKDPE
ncbi:hypothetical protein LCGC14_2802090 [marine sediment metagenome]|uniref:Uncharacterized protein n=1 Tax=marine sediment metagenome TaxID=412755 RepID=A0A0F9AVU6_9ZZZZ